MNQTKKLLDFIGSTGVAFGVDAAFQRRTEIEAAFRGRKGPHRFLFDSKCLTRESHTNWPKERLCSVHELLTANIDFRIKTSESVYKGSPQIRFMLEPNVPSCANGTEALEFIFTRYREELEVSGGAVYTARTRTQALV